MTHGSLFSGIGGFDLAAEWMGWENKFHCEWNEFGQKVLHHYWPNAEQFTDITKTDFTKYANSIDIISGGFPCQPYSLAGKRKGKEDERHLWPEMRRAIREIRPRWVVGENVFGLINWSGGLVFHEVQADLEAEGYEVFPYVLPACSVNAPHRRDRVWFVAFSKSARANRGENSENAEERTAPNSDNDGCNEQQRHECCCQNDERCNTQSKWTADSENFNNGDSRKYFTGEPSIDRGVGSKRYTKEGEPPHSNGICRMDKKCVKCQGFIKENRNTINKSGTLVQERQSGVQLPINKRMGNYTTIFEPDRTDEYKNDYNNIKAMDGDAADTDSKRRGKCNISGKSNQSRFLNWRIDENRNYWQNFPTQSPVCNGDDGISSRLDSITFSKWRNESIKAGGNAIVPQVALQIFKAIEQYENLTKR